MPPSSASTVSSPKGSSPSSPGSSSSPWVRPAQRVDYWAIADLHCCAFYPRATPFWFALLRLDRVLSLQMGEVGGRGRWVAGPGNRIGWLSPIAQRNKSAWQLDPFSMRKISQRGDSAGSSVAPILLACRQ